MQDKTTPAVCELYQVAANVMNIQYIPYLEFKFGAKY